MVKRLSRGLTLFMPLLLTASLMSVSCTNATVNKPRREVEIAQHVLNINNADFDSLQSLPGIGPQLAAKIIEHRARYGPFRKREHLLIVEGISETRYREVEKLITTN